MKIWIDIDNPPQVQYLVPFQKAFEKRGMKVVVTARDYGDTVRLLEQAGVEAAVFGERFGHGRIRKAHGLLARARDLGRFLQREGPPDAMLGASRPAAVVAWRLRIPSFIVGDYEWANVSVYRLTGSYILYPAAADPDAFTQRGLRKSKLIRFDGLKEDISFAGIDLNAVDPYPLPLSKELVRVLFRPPSESSHYYRKESKELSAAVLQRLARSENAVVVFSPRDRSQRAYLDGLQWRNTPLVLDRPIPFVELLTGVDLVVCSGGTMLREAGYLGIPAVSIFQSRIGGVDRYLASLGRVRLINSPGEFDTIPLVKRGAVDVLESNPRLLDDLTTEICARLASSRRWLGAAAV